MRLVAALRKERPDVVIHVRGDAGFGVPWMYAVCEGNGLYYTFGFSLQPPAQEDDRGPDGEGGSSPSRARGRKPRLFECLLPPPRRLAHARDVVAKGGATGAAPTSASSSPTCLPLPAPPARPGPRPGAGHCGNQDRFPGRGGIRRLHPPRRERAPDGRAEERAAHRPPELPSVPGQLLPPIAPHRRLQPAQRRPRRFAHLPQCCGSANLAPGG